MPKSSNGGEQGHNFWDLALNGLDDTTTPAIVAFGQLGKDSTGVWRQVLVASNGGLVPGLGGNPNTGQISVLSASATQIVAPNTSRTQGVAIANTTTQPIWLGTSAVTSATGLYLTGVPGTTIMLPTTSAIYGIVSGTAQTVSYMEI